MAGPSTAWLSSWLPDQSCSLSLALRLRSSSGL